MAKIKGLDSVQANFGVFFFFYYIAWGYTAWKPAVFFFL